MNWPASEVLANRAVLVIEDLERRFQERPMGAWNTQPTSAVVAPIMRQGLYVPAGFFVCGVNPHRRLDAPYLGSIKLVAGQIASGSETPTPTRRSASAPMRWRKLTGPRLRSSPMSAMSFARR